MIGVKEAKRIILEHVPTLPVETRALADLDDAFVATDIRSPHDHPRFDMSAVDGYAFAHAADTTAWTVSGAVAAGAVLDHALQAGECARIFTGAAIPQGADTVVMQEFVTRTGDRITHTDVRLKRGANVRKQGEQVRAGEVVLPRGSRSGAAAKGLLASVGVATVQVVRTPTVHVLITGSEFAAADSPLPGKIFNSNAITLDALLGPTGVARTTVHVADEAPLLEQALADAAQHSDVLITTGGASVGDHDLLRPALLALGATIHFHGVAQKPGKPMLFATLNGVPVFGLPGNPRAVMVLFWEYVLPFLRAMKGARSPWPEEDALPLTHALQVKGDRAEFRAARTHNGSVTLLADEGSHMLRSLLDADAIAYLPATQRSWAVGDPVIVHHLPHDR